MMTTKKIFKIGFVCLLLAGFGIYIFLKKTENYKYHIEALQKLQKFDLSHKNNADTNQILSDSSIYDFFYQAIPQDSFYYHYEALKRLAVNSPNKELISNEMQKALAYYQTALKICFIRENQLVYEYTMSERPAVLNETSYKEVILLKLKSYNYNKFNFLDIDEDPILVDSLSDEAFKEKILFRCRICALWKRFINFYKKETGDTSFISICKKNHCVSNK